MRNLIWVCLFLTTFVGHAEAESPNHAIANVPHPMQERMTKAGVIVSYTGLEWKSEDLYGALKKTPFDLVLVNRTDKQNKRFLSTSFQDKDICTVFGADKSFKKIALSDNKSAKPNSKSGGEVCAFKRISNGETQTFVVKKITTRLPASSNVFKRQLVITEQNGKDDQKLIQWVKDFKELKR